MAGVFAKLFILLHTIQMHFLVFFIGSIKLKILFPGRRGKLKIIPMFDTDVYNDTFLILFG